MNRNVELLSDFFLAGVCLVEDVDLAREGFSCPGDS